MTHSLLLKNVRPWHQPETVDMLIHEGKIQQIAANISHVAANIAVHDAENKLLFPGFVDAHAHIDKSLWGREWYVNDVPRELGTIIANERAYRREHQPDPQLQSQRIVLECLRHGTTAFRTHVDIDNEIGIQNFEGVMATKEKLRGVVDMETVAFPQSGILRNPGTEAWLRKALEAGADYIGGLDPCAYEQDPVTHLNIIFRLAAELGKGVDIHLHERGELGAFSVGLILDKTREFGLQNRVTISHAFCLGMVAIEEQQRLAEQLAALGISIATTAPVDIAVPPYQLLRAAGVVICAGNDGVRDTWNPYGNGDMLFRAMMIGLKYRWRKDKEMARALDAITHGGAHVMNLPDYGIAPGCTADLVLVPARVMAEAIVAQPAGRTVIKQGRVVVANGELCL
ncbi:Cytosine deaminase [Paramixta manurensis]|uniref:Cytosine deaminase n=1 Tax=Paramixta manurensis TaxID=2740817 RepID=A0A6M8UHL2_9GAMM|nr:Cytosine deaminase [Erwiniaceae bacterium PD-1]